MLEATLLTNRIARLMLYELPLHEPVANNLAATARLEEMIKTCDLERALITFQAEIVKQSPEEIARMKTRPTWAGLVASVAVLPRQMRALSTYRFDAGRMKTVTTPTLLLLGQETASPYARRSIAALRESLPNPTLVVLERQEHNAMEVGRGALADAIMEFVARQSETVFAQERSRAAAPKEGPGLAAGDASISARQREQPVGDRVPQRGVRERLSQQLHGEHTSTADHVRRVRPSSCAPITDNRRYDKKVDGKR